MINESTEIKHPEPSVDFDYDAVDGDVEGHNGDFTDIVHHARQETAVRIFQLLFDKDPTPDEFYRRGVLIRHLYWPEKTTHEELGVQLGLTRSRVTQLLTSLRGENKGN